MSNKNVLLLGAGMVSDPLVDYFCRLGTVNVTVATRSAENGQRLLRIGPRVTLVVADVQNGWWRAFE
jgi:saccharopine dehydrogenase-like NADP-dependent oxidoreductase